LGIDPLNLEPGVREQPATERPDNLRAQLVVGIRARVCALRQIVLPDSQVPGVGAGVIERHTDRLIARERVVDQGVHGPAVSRPAAEEAGLQAGRRLRDKNWRVKTGSPAGVERERALVWHDRSANVAFVVLVSLGTLRRGEGVTAVQRA